VIHVKRDPQTEILEATEKLLLRWSRECRENTKALGIPTSSSVQKILSYVQTESVKRRAKRKGVKKKALKKRPKISALGKQKRVFKTPLVHISSTVMTVDAAIATLPFWAKQAIQCTFLYGFPDRVAANRLKISRGDYAKRRRAAVEQVAAKLIERHNSDLPLLKRPAAP
jgi:hypothetical protein